MKYTKGREICHSIELWYFKGTFIKTYFCSDALSVYGYILSIVYVLPHYHKKTVNFIKEMRKRCSVLNLVFEKVTFLMEDIEKGYLFCDKWYIKRVKDWKLGWSLPTHNFVEYGCPNQFSQGLQTCVSSNSHWNVLTINHTLTPLLEIIIFTAGRNN